MSGGGATTVLVPPDRWARWVLNFQGRHGATALAVVDGGLAGAAADGSTFAAHLPFAAAYAGLPDAHACADAAVGAVPADWGLLLVRKGGFAVARVSGTTVVDSKVGQRHVQGRTKAGGQSQQRFARRRDNQARAAYEAAAGHAARILAGLAHVDGPVVTGGDRPAVEEVLGGAPLDRLRVVGPWLAVPDPRRAVLDRAVVDACALQVRVHNAS